MRDYGEPLTSNFSLEFRFYGVGEGEAAPSEGEADSEGDASVLAFFLVEVFFFRAGDCDGAGDAAVVAAVVEVAVVPCF